MDNKLIALVVTNLAGSGGEKVVLNMLNMFEKYSHSVYIFLLEDIVDYELTQNQKKKIIPLTENRKYHKLFSYWGDKVLHKNLEQKLLNIEKQEAKKFDLILSNLPYADRVVFYSKRQNVFNIIHTSYLEELKEYKKMGKIKRSLKKESLFKKIYNNKKLVCVSQGIKDDIDRLKIDYNFIDVIYNPFDIDYIRELGSVEVKDIPQEEYIISASAFRTVKRYDILLDAYKKLETDLKLIILSNHNVELEKLINDRGLQDKVEIIGFRKNPYPYIKHAKLLVLSSQREGLPTVLIESLILKTPIVSTNCISGPSEILVDKLSKYLAEVNNSDDLASKIKSALDDNIDIYDKFIDKFNEENIINQYLKLIC